jgi:DNA-binding response OmpR family regulator
VVWGYTAFPTTRTVDKHIVGLRHKIEDDPEQPRWITTVHGVGYRLEMPPEETGQPRTRSAHNSPEVTKR